MDTPQQQEVPVIWFTNDAHFGHENMLRLCDRPWSTVAQMNDAMVASINSKVTADDELYIWLC